MRQVTAAAIIVTAVAGAATAQGIEFSASTKSRATIFASQARLLDTRLSRQYENSERLRPKTDAAVEVASLRYGGNYRGEFLAVAKAAAQTHGVPEDLFLRLVQTESGWNPAALSVKGAVGLAQLMPGTAAVLGVDPADPEANLQGGAQYLRRMYDRFGSWRLALAAYNAGPAAVEEHKGIPPFAETTAYVRQIMGI